jgi:hypothetical protein
MKSGIEVKKIIGIEHNSNTRRVHLKAKQAEIITKLQLISDFVLKAFSDEDKSTVNKEWLKYQILYVIIN